MHTIARGPLAPTQHPMMEVISTRRYEARPAATVATPGSLVDHENAVATVKEEEWETRKKKEITTTRQIETRVKRQVVLEDGEVVVDSGPVVTTNTTEDVEQQEHTTHERKTAGDEPKEIEWSRPEDRQETSGVPSILQKESNETVVRSREEIEERLETEDRQQLGDISDEVYLKAVQNNRGDLRLALAESSKQVVPAIGPRVVQHTTRSNKVTDTENKLEKSQVQADGRIVTETKKTVEHEEVNDDEVPDRETDNFEDGEKEVRKEGSHRFIKQKDEELVDYVSGGERVAREMRYVSENTEGERIGDWPPVPTTMRTTRLHKHTGLPENVPINRKDALTKKPLDLEEEDEARKVETSKWLESHFGSESRSSHGSLDLDDAPVQSGTNTSFINVTMKSLPMSSSRDRDGWDRNHPNTSYPSHQHSLTKRADRRDSNSSAGYFHGISEWSERYQNQNTTEKQNSQISNTSPTSYPDNVRTNGYQEVGRNPVEWTYSNTYGSSRQQHQETRSKIELQDNIDAPSPPLRRRAREQILARQEDKHQAVGRVASPVNVVQRTWESRSRAIQKEKESVNHSEKLPSRKVSAESRSTSPIPAPLPSNQTKKAVSPAANTRTPKATGHSKYKIGESFRKLVGKLRSASSERKNKRNNTASSVTQTDDTSTYLQYNVIDKNIPSVTDYDIENKPPERPPRSPKPAKAHWQQSNEGPPVQRYYLGEDPFGGSSIYGREMGYSGSKQSNRHHHSIRETADTRVEPSSIGRFSKSTSRLANEYDRNEQFRSTQTLPRKLHTPGRQHHVSSSTLTRTRPNQRQQKPQSPQTITHTINNRQYGSMINISIKNTVTSSKLAANNSGPVPSKPERTYKSSLLRSKSFNVEANRDNNDPNSLPNKSNLQLNRLDETPPLKSPGILASISRSNRDLFKEAKYEY